MKLWISLIAAAFVASSIRASAQEAGTSAAQLEAAAAEAGTGLPDLGRSFDASAAGKEEISVDDALPLVLKLAPIRQGPFENRLIPTLHHERGIFHQRGVVPERGFKYGAMQVMTPARFLVSIPVLELLGYVVALALAPLALIVGAISEACGASGWVPVWRYMTT